MMGAGIGHEARAIAFAQRFHGQLSTRIVPFRWGSAYLDDEMPLRYGSNFLLIEGSPSDVDAHGLIAEADRVLGGEGYQHRIVGVDDDRVAAELAPTLESKGWTSASLTLMVLDPMRPAAPKRAATTQLTPRAREVFAEQMQPLLEKSLRRSERQHREETIAALSGYPKRLASATGARFFASSSKADGPLVAGCDLYIDGEEAQVESVATLAEAQGSGHGTAVVVAAVEAAMEAGATWIHLWAEADDWPRHWYERLGFVSVGSYCEFRKVPS